MGKYSLTLLSLLRDWAIIIFALSLATLDVHASVLVLVVITVGVHLHRVALIGHEAAHRMLAEKRWMNDALANLFCFWPLGTTLADYRRVHFPHHADPAGPEDPEWLVKRCWGWSPLKSPGDLPVRVALDLVGAGIPCLMRIPANVTGESGDRDRCLPRGTA